MVTVDVRKSAILLVAAALVSFNLIVGCGGGGLDEGLNPTNGANPGYSFNSDELNCPAASLIIYKDSGGQFPANSDVTFKNISTGTSYDAGAGVPISSGLDTGLPSGAPAGDYAVFVTPPGGSAVEVGTIGYTLTNCSA